MTTVTLEAVQARQAELTAMIAALTQQSTTLQIPAAEITLAPGEHYAGPVLDAAGQIQHHLVLMAAKPDDTMTWGDAMAWAEKVGGSLPTRQEQALLFANCKPHLEPAWHWSSETKGESYAWFCLFDDGFQYYSNRSSEGCAVAVRRF
jgi:hypothetical protein